MHLRPQLPVLLHAVLRAGGGRHPAHHPLGRLRAHFHAPARGQGEPHEDEQQTPAGRQVADVRLPPVDEAGEDDAGHLPRLRHPLVALPPRARHRPLRPVPPRRAPVRVAVRPHARQRQLHHLRRRQQEHAAPLQTVHLREVDVSPLRRARRAGEQHRGLRDADRVRGLRDTDRVRGLRDTNRVRVVRDRDRVRGLRDAARVRGAPCHRPGEGGSVTQPG